MTRIIAGRARSRRIQVPAGGRTRPTSDRAREGLFSTLESLLGGLEDIRFLDLYAGSGAVGLEALSRGAGHALLVESDERVARTLSANVEALGFAAARVAVVRVEKLVSSAPPEEPYDVVFADPPYAVSDDELRAVLDRARAHGWLAPSAVTAVERSSRSPWEWPLGITPDRFRAYGEATLWYGLAAEPVADGDGSSPRDSFVSMDHEDDPKE